jgi:transposase InsO family protein
MPLKGIVLDAFSRRVVGWTIDTTQTIVPVTNALRMATRRRDPAGGLVIHTDRGVQFTSWAFSQKVREADLAPSIGAVGSPYDNGSDASHSTTGPGSPPNRLRTSSPVSATTAAV